MSVPHALSEEEFKACLAYPMRDVIDHGDAKADIWPYVDALVLDELGIPSINDVHHVYRDARDWYDQVLIGTGRFNTLLVIVVDRRKGLILGHRLVDLNREYSVSGGHLRVVP